MQFIIALKENMKIDEVSYWEAFQGVAKFGNFSKASRHLGVTLPQLSKRVSKLENHLGVRLFQRSTRAVSLTNEGKALLPRISALLEEWSSAESLFDTKSENLKGTIRITSIPFVAHRLLIPAVSEFARLHPQVALDFELSEEIQNLVESNIDIAIRIHNEPPDSSLIYRKLLPNTLIACASPIYLKSNTAPLKKPQDLSRHELLSLKVHSRCQFKGTSIQLAEFNKSKRTSCENGWFLTQLALSGNGILIRSKWDVQEHLQKGELVEVLKDFPLGDFGYIYAVIPSRKFLAPRVSAFLDFILKKTAQLK